MQKCVSNRLKFMEETMLVSGVYVIVCRILKEARQSVRKHMWKE